MSEQSIVFGPLSNVKIYSVKSQKKQQKNMENEQHKQLIQDQKDADAAYLQKKNI